MPDDKASSYILGNKFSMYGIGSIVMIMALPSLLLLTKIAMGVAMVLIITGAIKIASKAISDLLQDNKNEVKNLSENIETQEKNNSEAISDLLQDNKNEVKNLSENIETQEKNNSDINNQGKVGATITAITALLVGITSLFIITEIGIITTCSAVTSLVFYECIKNDEMGKSINEKFNDKIDKIYDFSIKGIDKIISESRKLIKQ